MNIQTGNSDRTYCVYVLTDPRTCDYTMPYGWWDPEKPFYVGQGHPYRAWEHKREAEKSKRSNLKLNKIRKILREYDCYGVVFVGVNLTRDQAIKMEKEYISKFGRADLKKGPRGESYKRKAEQHKTHSQRICEFLFQYTTLLFS